MIPATDAVLARVSPGYPPPLGRLPTCYSPVRRSPVAEATFAHDLHVLSTPPAFILSQDQTLQFRSYSARNRLAVPGRLVSVSESAPRHPKATRAGSSSRWLVSSSVQFSKNRLRPLQGESRLYGKHGRLSTPPQGGKQTASWGG